MDVIDIIDSGVFIINFEQLLYIVVFPLLNLSK